MRHVQSAKRKGAVVVLVALTLTLLLGIVAIALDGGLLLHDRRLVQTAADAAALAAVDDLYLNYQTGAGLDSGGTATAKARAVAAANGYANDGTAAKVDVHIPPLSGPHTGQAGCAEVVVTYNQKRGFSNIFGSGDLPVTARSVARGQWTAFRNGIMVLDPYLSGSLNNGGNGQINVVDADVIVDSNSPSAATATGGGTISAPNFYITGVPGTSTSGGGTFSGNLVSNQPPTPDPLAYLPVPNPDTMMVQSKNPTNYAGNQTVTLQPGVYKGGIHVSGQVTVNMAPGIYYMDGGGFSFTGQGSLNATGVMVYTAPKTNSDVININGLGQISFTPPTTGIYRGMALWQARSSTNTLYLTGNGTSALYGSIYAQHGMLTVSGNGAQDVIGSQYVSYDVNLGGNGNFNISWQQNLTARTRLINLVE